MIELRTVKFNTAKTVSTCFLVGVIGFSSLLVSGEYAGMPSVKSQKFTKFTVASAVIPGMSVEHLDPPIYPVSQTVDQVVVQATGSSSVSEYGLQ
jgi:hypothetical protein